MFFKDHSTAENMDQYLHHVRLRELRNILTGLAFSLKCSVHHTTLHEASLLLAFSSVHSLPFSQNGCFILWSSGTYKWCMVLTYLWSKFFIRSLDLHLRIIDLLGHIDAV